MLGNATFTALGERADFASVKFRVFTGHLARIFPIFARNHLGTVGNTDDFRFDSLYIYC